MAIRPSSGNTSTPKFVPSVMTTSALADPKSSNVQSRPVITLVGTTHLQIREFIVTDFETYLHRLTTNLAVLNIGLIAATNVEQYAD